MSGTGPSDAGEAGFGAVRDGATTGGATAQVAGGRGSGADDVVGISVSGGGIRAAAFGLGALQVLQERERLVVGEQCADHLSAVSGGSYIVGAMAMLKSTYPYQHDSDRDDADLDDTEPFPVEEIDDPFGPGTPELEHVRRHARYLAGGDGAAGLALNVGLRIVLNLAFILLVVFVPMRMLGWLLGWAVPELGVADVTGDAFSFPTIEPLLWIGIPLIVLGLVPELGSILWGRPIAGVDRVVMRQIVWLVGGLGALLVAIGWVLPALMEWIVHGLYGSAEVATDGPIPTDDDQLAEADLGLLGRVGGVSTVATIVTSLIGMATGKSEGPSSERWFGRVGRLAVKVVRWVFGLVALVSVPVMLGAVAVAGLLTGATNSPLNSYEDATVELLLVGGAALLLFLGSVFADPVKWSLYPFYKRKLMRCFCLERRRGSDVGAPTSVRGRPYTARMPMSASQPADMPEIIICAAANISEDGHAPAGQKVLPYVLSAAKIGFPHGQVAPGSGECVIASDTLERAVGRDVGSFNWAQKLKGSLDASYVTMPSAIAITGAAVSPMMGKMTMAPFRALFGLMNFRLGVWLPNPNNDKVREQMTNHRPVSRRRPLAIFRELFGTLGVHRRLLYVSDGGHYENLGVVELFRRRCTRIICIDASGDRPGTVDTVSEALLLAQGECGVRFPGPQTPPWTEELSLDPEMTERRRAPTLRDTSASIDFEYSDGLPGTLLVLRIGVAAATSDVVKQFQLANKPFPYDSTGNQLFRSDRFDAYVALGRDTAERALA